MVQTTATLSWKNQVGVLVSSLTHAQTHMHTYTHTHTEAQVAPAAQPKPAGRGGKFRNRPLPSAPGPASRPLPTAPSSQQAPIPAPTKPRPSSQNHTPKHKSHAPQSQEIPGLHQNLVKSLVSTPIFSNYITITSPLLLYLAEAGDAALPSPRWLVPTASFLH